MIILSLQWRHMSAIVSQIAGCSTVYSTVFHASIKDVAAIVSLWHECGKRFHVITSSWLAGISRLHLSIVSNIAIYRDIIYMAEMQDIEEHGLLQIYGN